MIRHLLNASVDVYRPTFTADGRGGRTRSMAKVAMIRARISQPSSAERAIAAQLDAVLEHVIHVLPGADVSRNDELDVGGPRRLRVQAVLWDSSRTYWRLECQAVESA